jgi:hypothetical protein
MKNINISYDQHKIFDSKNLMVKIGTIFKI